MPKRRASISPLSPVADSAEFYRHLVSNMRNGVLAIERSGAVVLINEEARRIFRLPDGHLQGLRFDDVLRDHPDIVRVLGGVFDRPTLPNRASAYWSAA